MFNSGSFYKPMTLATFIMQHCQKKRTQASSLHRHFISDQKPQKTRPNRIHLCCIATSYLAARWLRPVCSSLVDPAANLCYPSFSLLTFALRRAHRILVHLLHPSCASSAIQVLLTYCPIIYPPRTKFYPLWALSERCLG